MNAAQYINQTSRKQDWMTPVGIIEAARAVMGGIDLDPASSHIANQRIKATTYFTPENDGLGHRWWGRVWLNWPFGKEENKYWSERLLLEYEEENISQACAIMFAATSEVWFQEFYQFPICFLAPRTQYIDPATMEPVKGVTRGSCVVYLGPHRDRFAQVFHRRGHVLVGASFSPPDFTLDHNEEEA